MKLFFISTILIFFTNSVHSQIVNHHEKLWTLTKVYGVVKYYNNEKDDGYLDIVASQVFPKLKEIDYSIEIFNADLANLIPIDQRTLNSGAEISNVFDQFEGIDHVRTIDFSWIEQDDMLTDKSKKLLRQLINSHKYISNSNIKQKHVIVHYENNETDSPSYPNHYLLGLMKFWNVIEYFFPYKKLMDKNWDMVLHDAIPDFQSINSDEEYVTMLKKLSAHLNDSHVDVEGKPITDMEKLKLPFSISIAQDQLVIQSINDSLSNLYHIKTGDVIEELDGKNYEGLWKEFSNLVAFSSPQAGKSDFTEYLWNRFNRHNGIVEAKIQSNGNIHLESIKTIKWNDFEMYRTFYNDKQEVIQIPEGIGYIQCFDVNKSYINKAIKIQKHLRLMILDCRGWDFNPGLLHVLDFLGNNKVPFAKQYFSNLYYPGIFDNPEVRISYSPSIRNAYRGRLIVLINEEARSTMESLLMEIKTRRSDVIFMGTPTQGSNGQISLMVLPGEQNILFTGGSDWRYPDDAQFQRIGIKPTILVEPSVESIANNEDAILNFALEYLGRFN